jgi:predicted DNA-binding transcriptional regulator AlpA
VAICVLLIARKGVNAMEQKLPSEKRYLRKTQVRQRYGGISNDTVRRLVKQGRLPAPEFPLSTNRPMWNEAELDAADKVNTINATAG